jgi:hypothetical protein
MIISKMTDTTPPNTTPGVPFFWRGDSGCIWMRCTNAMDVCVGAAGRYGLGETIKSESLADARKRKLPAGSGVTMVNGD